MPAIAQDEELRQREQELIAEEQRRLEEAALMASQNFISQPDAEIAALQTQFNQPMPPMAMPTREAYTKDSEQYALEVARAQRGSGFINADIGPSGNVITPGYDPGLDPRAIIARREAENLQRNQYVNTLVNDGATYAEALRAGLGRYPSTGDPAMMLKAEALALKQKPTLLKPEITTVDGLRVLRTGPNSFSRIAETKIQGGKPSPAIFAQADNLKNQIAALRKKLAPSSSGIVLLAPQEIAATEAQIAQKERERVALFEGPESNPLVDQPGWERMRAAFNAPSRAPVPDAPTPATPAQTKAANELRRVTKDGKVAVYDAETKKFIRFE